MADMNNVREYHVVDVVEHNIENLVSEVYNFVLKGYRISPTNKGTSIGLYGNCFAVSMVRDEQSVTDLRAAVAKVPNVPPMDAATKMAKARAGKKQTSNVEEVANLNFDEIISDK